MTASNEPRSESLRAKLAEAVGPVLYSDLHAHVARGAVFVVAKGVELLDCAVAMATDDVSRVQRWMDEGLLRRPTPDELAQWSATAERKWLSVVVQPYVLVQDA